MKLLVSASRDKVEIFDVDLALWEKYVQGFPKLRWTGIFLKIRVLEEQLVVSTIGSRATGIIHQSSKITNSSLGDQQKKSTY